MNLNFFKIHGLSPAFKTFFPDWPIYESHPHFEPLINAYGALSQSFILLRDLSSRLYVLKNISHAQSLILDLEQSTKYSHRSEDGFIKAAIKKLRKDLGKRIALVHSVESGIVKEASVADITSIFCGATRDWDRDGERILAVSLERMYEECLKASNSMKFMNESYLEHRQINSSFLFTNLSFRFIYDLVANFDTSLDIHLNSIKVSERTKHHSTPIEQATLQTSYTPTMPFIRNLPNTSSFSNFNSISVGVHTVNIYHNFTSTPTFRYTLNSVNENFGVGNTEISSLADLLKAMTTEPTISFSESSSSSAPSVKKHENTTFSSRKHTATLVKKHHHHRHQHGFSATPSANRLTFQQSRTLRTTFYANRGRLLSSKQLDQLVSDTGLSKARIGWWYTNARRPEREIKFIPAFEKAVKMNPGVVTDWVSFCGWLAENEIRLKDWADSVAEKKKKPATKDTPKKLKDDYTCLKNKKIRAVEQFCSV